MTITVLHEQRETTMQDLECEGLGERFTIVAVALDHADQCGHGSKPPNPPTPA
jgi:hypothetical protein